MVKLKNSFDKRKSRNRYSIKNKSAGKLRLSVFRSNNHIYAQLIDDAKGVTLISSSSVSKDLCDKVKSLNGIEVAKLVGEDIGKKCVSNNLTSIVFDRGAYRYDGRVKALADAARSSGLEF